jgi:hypothetical protein
MRTSDMIAEMIVERLGTGDASHLIILVSVRKALNAKPFKGDLSTAVGSALRRLVDAGTINNYEGIYSLVAAGDVV